MAEHLQVWELASAAFFIYTAVVSALLRDLPPHWRRSAALLALAGFLITVGSVALPPSPVLDHWVIPPALLLLGYWASGRLFIGPMAGAERRLLSADQRLGVPAVSSRLPRACAEYLELAYLGVYPVMPIALGLYLTTTPSPDADRFWTVVLVTDYVCFGVLPWVQTRPPRALEPGPPWRSAVRRFNEKLLGAASIHVNTFPSGHAAEALVVALLLVAAPWPVAAAMFAVAVSITAGAVLGRYHYALDAVAGWVVALAVWGLFRV